MTSATMVRPSSVILPPHPLHLDAATWQTLFTQFGPSLGLWRAAEVAVLRECEYAHPSLDLGGGDGIVASLVLSQIEIGLDPNKPELDKAAQRGVYQNLIPLPMQEAPLADASIGTVLSNSVLEHIPQIETVLQAIARVLRPGGRLIFTTPTEAFSTWLALPSASYAARRNRALVHLNLWPIERWSMALRRVGLEVQIVRPYLCREVVSFWDFLELGQQVRMGRRRLFGMLWRRVPPSRLQRLARFAAGLDLASVPPGGGRLIVARKQ